MTGPKKMQVSGKWYIPPGLRLVGTPLFCHQMQLVLYSLSTGLVVQDWYGLQSVQNLGQ